MSRAQLALDRVLDPIPHLPAERLAGRHDDKQTHRLVAIKLASAADADGVFDFACKETGEHVVDLGRAEPNARGLEHAVGAAQHDQSARGRVHPHKVAVVPHARAEALKVGGLVLVVASWAEEGERLAREGLEADEVAFGTHGVDGERVGGVGGRVDHGDGHSQAGALDFARAHGEERAGCAEEGDDVRAAGDGGEVDGGWERGVDEGEGGRGEGRGGGVDGFETREVEVVDRIDGAHVVGFKGGQVSGRGAEVGYLERGEEAREREVAVRAEGRAGVEDQRGAARE